MLAYKQNIIKFPMTEANEPTEEKVHTATDTSLPKLNPDESRNEIVCGLWKEKNYTSTEIAERLGITRSCVMGIVNRYGLIRRPGRQARKTKKIETVSLHEAPIEAWQQAIMPELKIMAQELNGENNDMEQAIVILSLIILKEYAECLWLSKVSGYDTKNITSMLHRAHKARIIKENGTPNVDLKDDKEFVLYAGVINGYFLLTEDDKFSIGDMLSEEIL